jgi:dodecin
MTAHVYKKIELVGSSTIGTDDAIQNAIAKAALTIKNMDLELKIKAI